MKKTILAMMIALMACTMVNAQPKARNEHRPKGASIEHMIERRVSRLEKALQLTPEQKQAITQIYTDNAAKMKADSPRNIMEKGEKLSQDEMQKHLENMRAQQEQTEAKVAALLTPEQKEKFDQLKAEQTFRGKGNQGGRPHGPKHGHKGPHAKGMDAKDDCCKDKAAKGECKDGECKGGECKDKAAKGECKDGECKGGECKDKAAKAGECKGGECKDKAAKAHLCKDKAAKTSECKDGECKDKAASCEKKK